MHKIQWTLSWGCSRSREKQTEKQTQLPRTQGMYWARGQRPAMGTCWRDTVLNAGNAPSIIPVPLLISIYGDGFQL